MLTISDGNVIKGLFNSGLSFLLIAMTVLSVLSPYLMNLIARKKNVADTLEQLESEEE